MDKTIYYLILSSIIQQLLQHIDKFDSVFQVSDICLRESFQILIMSNKIFPSKRIFFSSKFFNKH